VVADFASRGLLGFDVDVLRLFAAGTDPRLRARRMLDTHRVCASVSPVRPSERDLDKHYTPVQWIKEMTPVIVQILVAMTALIYIGAVLNLLLAP
jgi:hypothetical protein